MDPRELNHLFEQMSPAPDQEEAILARLQAPEKAVKIPSRRWKKSVFVLTATAAMALACAAAAFSALDPRLLSFFQRTPQDTELLGEGVVEVNQSHTYENGWTVSVRHRCCWALWRRHHAGLAAAAACASASVALSRETGSG